MITKKDQKTLKTLLKNDWVDDVHKELKRLNIVSKSKKPYSESMVRMVFNGHRENQEIETAILTVFNNRKTLAQKKEELKSQLLSA